MHMHNVDGVQIPFDKNWKNIAISVSGGVDSALLAFLLCEITQPYKTTVHIINHVRCWKSKPWQAHDADQIYNWLVKKFNNIVFVRHINFIAPELEYAVTGPSLTDEYGKDVSGDNIQQRAYAEYICFKHNIDAYYNAVTRNPKGVDLGGMKERDIDPTDDNQHLYIMKHMNKIACHPFRFVDKSWVYAQYKRLNLLDLFNITRSCEGMVDGINYLTYEYGQEVPVCRRCFWCKEREWAIEQNK